MVIIAEPGGLLEQEKSGQCLVGSGTAYRNQFARNPIHLDGGLAQSQIVVGGEDPNLVAAIALKLRFVSKHQGAHDGMQPVGTHQQVEAAGGSPTKGHVDSS